MGMGVFNTALVQTIDYLSLQYKVCALSAVWQAGRRAGRRARQACMQAGTAGVRAGGQATGRHAEKQQEAHLLWEEGCTCCPGRSAQTKSHRSGTYVTVEVQEGHFRGGGGGGGCNQVGLSERPCCTC